MPLSVAPALASFRRDVLDLLGRNALVEPAVAEVERLDLELSARLGSLGFRGRQHPLLELAGDDRVGILENFVARRAELGELVAVYTGA